MVRKTRSSMKAAEKSKTESPKRSRRNASNQRERSGSRSDASDEDVSRNVTKHLSPNRPDKGSSENESDKDSKKPLKKRSRSMAIKEETQQPSPHKSRWDKQHKSPPININPQDIDEEVKEDQNSKGKSKNKNNSNNDNVVNPETENENVQVTDESPSDAKDDNHETQPQNGEGNKEIFVNTSSCSNAETNSEQQFSETSSEQNVENLATQCDTSATIPGRASSSPSKENSDKSSNKHQSSGRKGSRERKSSEGSKESDKDYSERKDRKSRDRRSSERSSREIEQQSEEKQSDKKEDTKKIRLKRPTTDKRTSESEDKEGKKEENSTKKKITLKRLENKQHSTEESQPSIEINESLPQEQSQVEDWTSSYEVNNGHDDKQEKIEEKPARKRITLKRSTVEENKTSVVHEKKDTYLGRSISLQDNKDLRRKSTSDSIVIDVKRRRSSGLDRSTSENEEKPQMPKKPTKVVKLVRSLPQEIHEPPPPGEETVKKYKWGQSDISYKHVDILNLNTIKKVCPTIEFLKEDEVNLDVVVKEQDNKIANKERRKTFTELEEEEMENIEAELNAEPDEIEIKENIIAMNRKISIVEDTASKLKPPPSPARNPVSEVLFITNLVRPFTVKQLKELLERTGKIKDDGFWTDRIKSKCYVYYENIEEAEATRNALHGVNWPIGNGKKLAIDYATVDDLENAKKPPVPIMKEKSPEKENKKPVIEDEKDSKSIRTVKREWDLGKEDEHRRRRSRSRSRERQRKHSRRSYTPEDYHGKKRKQEEPAPPKAMDDLFFKTKATPSIYWQPLSPEEIALKQQQRQARLEENKRRLEEISRTASRGGAHRDRGGRDRNFRRR